MTSEEKWDEEDAIADALAMERAMRADGGGPQGTPPAAGADEPHPYATLTPERVLDAIERIGYR